MSEEMNFDGVLSSNWKGITPHECAPNITERVMWEGENGKRAIVYEFLPGSVFPGLDVHESGPEQIYIISGVFYDGKENHEEGSFIYFPKDTSHIPKSDSGCVLLVLYPEG